MKNILIYLICILSFSTIQAQVFLDEDFSDWENATLDINDEGDEFQNSLGMSQFSVSNDDDYLYFRVRFNKEINLQEDNNFTIYIDLDNNVETGFKVNGIGSDLSYTLGYRSGFYNTNNLALAVEHHEIGLISSPTYSSKEFELGIKRQGSVNGVNYNIENTITLSMLIGIGVSSDVIPNSDGGVSYTLIDNVPIMIDDYTLDKTEDEFVRLVSYNSKFDGFFNGSRGAKQRKILQALNPDIIAFQEIYDHSANEVKDVITNILPRENGEVWYAEKINPDIIVVSKYPIAEKYALGGNGVFKIKAFGAENKNLILFNCHFACCDNNTQRQMEVDQLMAFIKEMKFNSGPILVQDEDPFIICGDLNLVGFNEQLNTLLTGDIINEGTYGPDVMPDWDGSHLVDLKPSTMNLPAKFTWNDENSSYPKGRLDYVIYSGSVADVPNSFVFDSQNLSDEILSANSLTNSIVLEASDHMPLVADFDLNITKPLIANYSIEGISCFGFNDGKINIEVASGEEPYLYKLNDNDFGDNSSFENLSPGTYSVIIKDVAGQELLFSDLVVTEPAEIQYLIDTTSTQITINGIGGTGMLLYSNDGQVFEELNVFAVVPGIEYEFSILDENGCVKSFNYIHLYDGDMDGFYLGDDCNDDDNTIYPGAEEIPNNGIDEDCDGSDLLVNTIELANTTIKTYPNPVNDIIYFDIKGSSAFKVAIYNLGGKLIREVDFNSNTKSINLENLESGTYLINVIDIEGNNGTARIIKK